MLTLNFDSFSPAQGAYFARQLEHVREEVLKDKTMPRSGFVVFGQDTEVGEWDETYVHETYEATGIAQLVADDADDIPLADVSFREEIYLIRDFISGYKYTINELGKSQQTGRNIPTKRAEAARDAINNKMNRLMWYGDPVAKLFGATTFPNTPRRIMATPINGGTPATVLQMLNNAVNSIFTLTETNAQEFIVELASDDYAYIASTPVDLSGGIENSILNVFMKNQKKMVLAVEPRPELKGAGPTGNNIALIHAPGTFSHKVAMMFRQLDPQPKGLSFITPVMARSGGIYSDYPLEAVILELPAAT